VSNEFRSKAISHMSFNGLRLLITAGSTVCTSAIMARTLGPGNMGVYSYVIWLVGTLGIVANVGLPAALTKYVSEYIGRGDGATAAQIGRRLLQVQLGVAGTVAVLTACSALFKSPYRSMLVLAAAMIFLQAVQQGFLAALAGIQRFDRITLISLYVALAQVISVSFAAVMHASVLSMLWATLAGSTVGILLSYRAVTTFLLSLSKQSVRSPVPVADLYSRIWKFSSAISYVLLLDAIVWQRSEVLFLKWYSTLAQIAFYTLAYNVASKLSEISSTFSSALLPLYSESYGRSGIGELGPVYAKALKYVQMVMVFPCVLGAAVCKPLIPLIYGASYTPVVIPLQLLLITLAFTSIGTVGSPLLVGTEKQSFVAKYGTLVAIINIALDIVLIPKYGAVGAAVANCSAQAIGVLGGTTYVIRYTRVKFPWKSTAVIYLGAAVGIAPVVYCFLGRVEIFALAGAVVMGCLLYLGVLVVAGELGMKDLSDVRTSLLRKARSSTLVEAGGPA
jgi:O-antigen/teichoic acid export membrane protein